MNGMTIGVIAVAVVLIVDVILLLGLVTMKAVNRRRAQSYKLRRAAYVATLSRLLTSRAASDPIEARAAADDA
ncbi:MAG: hypothetical protein ACRDXF_07410, partial [Acidimicrobiia bacterium]